MASGKLLLNGQVIVLTLNAAGGIPIISYATKMETIAVTSCIEAMGCNNVMTTTVSLKATRIGWTYYDQSRTGVQTVSRKFG